MQQVLGLAILGMEEETQFVPELVLVGARSCQKKVRGLVPRLVV